jgi:transposase-like protein
MRVETIRIRMHLGDQEGHMLDEIVQTHRNTKAARHLLAPRRATSLGEARLFRARGNRRSQHQALDPRKRDVVGRLGGHGYTRTRDMFAMPTLSMAEWERISGS